MEATLKLITAIVAFVTTILTLKNFINPYQKKKMMTEKTLIILAIVALVMFAIVAMCYLVKEK